MSKKWQIIISYQTGNSYGLEDREEPLDGDGWESLEIARHNLRRIKEHYEWYQWQDMSDFQKKRNERDGKIGPKKPSFAVDDDRYPWILQLLADNGNEYQINTFWCGYFETLYGAKIEYTTDDNDMVFTI
jgi:hypothetical protein